MGAGGSQFVDNDENEAVILTDKAVSWSIPVSDRVAENRGKTNTKTNAGRNFHHISTMAVREYLKTL